MATTFDKLIADLQKQQESANLANQKRYDQMLAIYDEVINRYQPGGAFEKAGLQQLGQQKVQDIGGETQQMIGSGMYGTTTTAALPTKWEQQVGAPSRLKLEDIMMQRLSGAQIGKAGAIEGVSDVGPSYETIASLAMQAGQGGSQSTQGGYQGQYGVGLGGPSTSSGGFGGYAPGSGPGQAQGISPTDFGAERAIKETGSWYNQPVDNSKQIAEHQALLTEAPTLRLSADRIKQITEQLALLQSQSKQGAAVESWKAPNYNWTKATQYPSITKALGSF